MDKNLKDELIRTVFQFKKMTGAGFGIDATEIKSDINMTELVLMKGISDNSIDSESNIAMPDIRGYLSISKAAVSQMLRSLEKKGYINRDIDKNNRRNLIVTLTPKGREILSYTERKFEHKLEKIMTKLGEDDVKQLITIVNRLVEIVNNLDNVPEQE